MGILQVVQPWNRHPFARIEGCTSEERRDQSKRQSHFIPVLRYGAYYAETGGEERRVCDGGGGRSGVKVDQLFFHDPDGYMVEICNCHALPVLPLSSCPLKKLPNTNGNDMPSSFYGRFFAAPFFHFSPISN
ncbi:hypothetical protein L1049_014525 [Liquidambar formosana]|uniref:VOC domain-containing protein n=1 Tax=Liquidambar formosana TaxID=63359 RepID=A0AAP0RW57_LIQFO